MTCSDVIGNTRDSCHMRNRESHCKQSQESQVSLTAVTRDKPPEIKGAPIAKWHTSEQDISMVVTQLTATLEYQQNEGHKMETPQDRPAVYSE